MKVREYGGTSSGPTNGLKEGEIVDCMLIGFDYTTGHKKEVDEYNKKGKEEAEALGDPFVERKYSFKEGGVAWKIAVLRRNIKNYGDGKVDGEIVWKSEGESLVKPSYTATCTFQQLTPKQILSYKTATGILIGDMFQLGGGSQMIKEKPKVVKLLPSVKVSKDWGSGIEANAVPPGREEQYKDLIKQEKERLS